MSVEQMTKPIKISWTAPNGRKYEDCIPMTLEQYKAFVDNLLHLKHEQNNTCENCDQQCKFSPCCRKCDEELTKRRLHQ